MDKQLIKTDTTLKLHGKKRGLSEILQLPNTYLTFLVGQLLSRVGDSLYELAIPLISYELTKSALVMGSMYAISVLPIVMLGPIIGVLVDRLPRKKLMMSADIMRAVLVALIPTLHFFSALRIWHLYVISFLLTGLTLLFDVALVTAIPHMAGGKEQLTRANAAEKLVNQIASLGGPILAGISITAFGGFYSLWLDVFSFSATFLAIRRVRSLEMTVISTTIDSVFNDMKEGLRWLINDKLNITISLQAMVGNFGYSAAFGVLMYYLLNTLKLNPQQSSINYAMLGAGGIIGTLIVVPLEKRLRRGVLITILLMVGAVGFSMAAFSRYWLMPGIALGIVSLCNIGWNTVIQSLRQETVPQELLGRVLGFSRVFTRLAMPLGAMVGAFISEHYGAAAVFIIATVAKLLEIVIVSVSPMRKM